MAGGLGAVRTAVRHPASSETAIATVEIALIARDGIIVLSYQDLVAGTLEKRIRAVPVAVGMESASSAP
jgi:hypothetical protein